MKPVTQYRQLTPEFYDAWNSFVNSSPQGDVFCYSWWLDAITKGNFKILAVFENDEIVAGIPLAFYLGKINEPPLTRTLGPLFKNQPHLSEHDRSTVERRWLNMLLDNINLEEVEQFCTSHNFTDWLPFRWRGLKQMTRYTYLIDFADKSENELWAGLNRGRKETINKALKNNIHVEQTHNLSDFYHLIELTYERQGLAFRFPFDDFKVLDDEIVRNKRRVILTAFDADAKPHAAIYVLFNERSAFALLSAGDPQYRLLGAHTLVMWEAIKYFRDRVEFFNFGGSDIERIENHLRGFGGELKQYFHIFTEKTQVKEVEKIVEKEVLREILIQHPPPPDNWKYHVGLLRCHSWILIKKALYKLHIRFNLPIRVSVVVPCFNHGKFIPEMLQSVLNQTFPFYEVIIVNDGSTDNTESILKKIRHKEVTILHTANHGPAHARNLAITHARGDLIVNLDADDKIAPDFLRRCVEVMDANPDVGIVYTDAVLFGHKYEAFTIHNYTFDGMLRANCIIANACFRKCDWEKTDGYSSFLQFGYEDFDFWLSIIELGRKVWKIQEPMAFIRTYRNKGVSRSGRLKLDKRLIDLVVLQAFRRHRALYQQSPVVFAEFLEFEKKMATVLNEPPGFNPDPVFSIITPTKNRPGLLKRNIESLQKQSFTNWEQIIVDDANNQETRELLQSYNDQRIKYFAHENPKGAAGAYNTGMKNASGKYINFLDDDDEYLPGILEKIYQTFNESANCPGFVWTGITHVQDTDTGEEPIRTQVWPADFETHEQGLMVSTAIGNGFGLSVKMECLKKAGFYDESLKVGEDTDFMMRLSQHYSFRTAPEVLVKIHHHNQDQLTHDKYIKIKWESYGKIINRHWDFLSKHWDSLYMHHKVYVGLCFQLNEKKIGLKTLWRLAGKFPEKRITWLDLVSFLFEGKEYNTGKLKMWIKKDKFLKQQYKEQTARKRSIKKMDGFRNRYDKMTFGELVAIANIWLHEYPEQASYTMPFVQKWIINYVPYPTFVLEIGGWRGDLANAILNEFDKIECWDNYDVISDQSTQKCKHPKYCPIALSDYIWKLGIDTKYNALIATHVIEHLRWRELVLLIKWIPKNIVSVLFEAPIVESAENFNWKGHHSTHILEKGWKQVIAEMKKNGFEKVFEAKDTVIFKRNN